MGVKLIGKGCLYQVQFSGCDMVVNKKALKVSNKRIKCKNTSENEGEFWEQQSLAQRRPGNSLRTYQSSFTPTCRPLHTFYPGSLPVDLCTASLFLNVALSPSFAFSCFRLVFLTAVRRDGHWWRRMGRGPEIQQ